MAQSGEKPDLGGAAGLRAALLEAEARIGRGQLADGARQVEALLRAHPDYFTARTLLAGVRFGEGQLADALAHLDAALRLDPDNRALQLRTAQVERLSGAIPSAHRRLRHLVAEDPSDPEARWELAQLDLQRDDLELAIAGLLALPQDFSLQASARGKLGDAWERVGASDTARDLYEQLFLSPATPPADRANAAFRLCSLASTIDDDDLSAYLEGEGAAIDRIAALFARAALLHRRGRFGEAWAALVAANGAVWPSVRDAVLRQEQRYTAIEAYCRTASLEPVGASAAVSGPMPVLIVGPSRAGKSLVEGLAAVLPGLVRGFESDVLPDAIARATQRLDLPTLRDPWHIDDDSVEALRVPLRDLLTQRARGGRWLTLTSPANIFHVGLVARLYPEAPILFIRRDRTDLTARIFGTHYGAGHSYSYDLSALGRYLDWQDRLAAIWTERLGARCISVTYEQVVAAPQAVLAPLAARLGAAAPDRAADGQSDIGFGAPYRAFMAQGANP